MIDKDTKDFLKVICLILPFAIVFSYLAECCARKNRVEHENSVKYQIEIVDKYDCIGSTWHLVGGRAPEQEYHVIYKVTPLTPKADEEYYGDGEEDDEVSYAMYRKIYIGQKFNGTSNNIKRYNRIN